MLILTYLYVCFLYNMLTLSFKHIIKYKIFIKFYFLFDFCLLDVYNVHRLHIKIQKGGGTMLNIRFSFRGVFILASNFYAPFNRSFNITKYMAHLLARVGS